MNIDTGYFHSVCSSEFFLYFEIYIYLYVLAKEKWKLF